MDSNNPNGVFAGMGIPPMEYGKIITMIYLKVNIQLAIEQAPNGLRIAGIYYLHID